MVLGGPISLITWAGYFRGVPCVCCVCPVIVVRRQLLLACQWVGLTLRLTMTTVDNLLCGDWSHGVRFTLQNSGAIWVLPLGASVELSGFLVHSEVGHGVCWFWSFFWRAPVQAKVSICLYQIWGHLVGATEWHVVGCHSCWVWRHLDEAIL